MRAILREFNFFLIAGFQVCTELILGRQLNLFWERIDFTASQIRGVAKV